MKFELKRRGRELRFELRPRLVIWLILMVLFAIDTELKHSCAVYLLNSFAILSALQKS